MFFSLIKLMLAGGGGCEHFNKKLDRLDLSTLLFDTYNIVYGANKRLQGSKSNCALMREELTINRWL